jgi:hypothetical protein
MWISGSGQHIVWGEMVGLFFADVVSARDLRHSICLISSSCAFPSGQRVPNTISARPTPSWSGFPSPSYDRIGKPGAEFYPLPRGQRAWRGQARQHPRQHQLGCRLSRLVGGWDVSGFYYRSLDVAQTFYVVGGTSSSRAMTASPRSAATMAKDFGEFVLKGERCMRGRQVQHLHPTAPNGLVRRTPWITWSGSISRPSTMAG